MYCSSLARKLGLPSFGGVGGGFLGVGFPFQPFLYSFACFITPVGHNPGFFYTFVDLKT